MFRKLNTVILPPTATLSLISLLLEPNGVSQIELQYWMVPRRLYCQLHFFSLNLYVEPASYSPKENLYLGKASLIAIKESQI